MDVPEQWRDFPCDDYYSSSFATEGYWHKAGQLRLIEPAEHVHEDQDAEFLQVGRLGVDSIGLGYRKGQPGFWAFHRTVDRDFQYLAPSIQEFLDGWLGGWISVCIAE